MVYGKKKIILRNVDKKTPTKMRYYCQKLIFDAYIKEEEFIGLV